MLDTNDCIRRKSKVHRNTTIRHNTIRHVDFWSNIIASHFNNFVSQKSINFYEKSYNLLEILFNKPITVLAVASSAGNPTLVERELVSVLMVPS